MLFKEKDMLSKSSLYVLKALSILSNLPSGQYLGAQAISSRTGIPANYLGKMLQALTKSGYVISQKGMGGGFRLTEAPDKITLLEIIEAFEQESLLQTCFWGKQECDESQLCPMHDRWKEIVSLTRNTFSDTTLEDIKESLVQ